MKTITYLITTNTNQHHILGGNRYIFISDEEDGSEQGHVQQILSVDELTLNQFVLYKWKDGEHYVGTVDDVQLTQIEEEEKEQNSKVSVGLMKKYFVRGRKAHFLWPTQPHSVEIDDLERSKCLRSLPEPTVDRRGTTVILDISAFGKIALNNIM